MPPGITRGPPPPPASWRSASGNAGTCSRRRWTARCGIVLSRNRPGRTIGLPSCLALCGLARWLDSAAFPSRSPRRSRHGSMRCAEPKDEREPRTMRRPNRGWSSKLPGRLHDRGCIPTRGGRNQGRAPSSCGLRTTPRAVRLIVRPAIFGWFALRKPQPTSLLRLRAACQCHFAVLMWNR